MSLITLGPWREAPDTGTIQRQQFHVGIASPIPNHGSDADNAPEAAKPQALGPHGVSWRFSRTSEVAKSSCGRLGRYIELGLGVATNFFRLSNQAV